MVHGITLQTRPLKSYPHPHLFWQLEINQTDHADSHAGVRVWFAHVVRFSKRLCLGDQVACMDVPASRRPVSPLLHGGVDVPRAILNAIEPWGLFGLAWDSHLTLVVQMLDSDVLYLHEAEYVNDNLYPEKGMHFPCPVFCFCAICNYYGSSFCRLRIIDSCCWLILEWFCLPKVHEYYHLHFFKPILLYVTNEK